MSNCLTCIGTPRKILVGEWDDITFYCAKHLSKELQRMKDNHTNIEKYYEVYDIKKCKISKRFLK